MNLNNLSTVLQSEPKYRYTQVNKFVYSDFISNWSEASSLSKDLRKKLEELCPLEIKAEIVPSDDSDSKKALITLEDEEKVETVLISQASSKGEKSDKRYTVCVSSQVGCPLACTFCATGKAGFSRNLSAAEIVEQVVHWGRYLKEKGKIDNIVFMGMGEPFLNYEEFIKAAKFINSPETLNIGARRLSVSTAGIVPGIKRLSGEKMQINLAISLHAASDTIRQKLMPHASKYKIDDILKSVDAYINRTGRRVMFEYLMLKGVNDSPTDAKNLARLLRRPLYFLNLIPYNNTGVYQASSKETMESFQKILESAGVTTTLRHSHGSDINAACGQLSHKKKDDDKNN